MAKLPSLDELNSEIAQLREPHALPADDQAFVFGYCLVALRRQGSRGG